MQPTPEHIAFMQSLKDALAEHKHLSGAEMLAIASQFVGNLIALQDQTRYTPEQAMTLVARNIEIGNAAALETVLNSQGQA